MSSIADLSAGDVIAGVDTHRDTVHAAVLDHLGRRQADREFATTAAGYGALLRWLRRHGRVRLVGVEGTGSYGAGLAGYLAAAEVAVVEVDRPDRRTRRQQGKSDPVDAYAAAAAALAGRATTRPKTHTGAVEAIRAVHRARRGAVKARTAAINELKGLLVTAAPTLRETLTGRTTADLVVCCARLRPTGNLADPTVATKTALRRLARRIEQLTTEIADADTDLATLIAAAAPQLLDQPGIGTETAAALLIAAGDNHDRIHSDAGFAKICGVAPLDASSGAITRQRLNRGGNRDANRALHVIALSRLRHDPRTRAYRTRRSAAGRSNRDILRSLKRYLAREIYYLLNPAPAHTTPQAA